MNVRHVSKKNEATVRPRFKMDKQFHPRRVLISAKMFRWNEYELSIGTGGGSVTVARLRY